MQRYTQCVSKPQCDSVILFEGWLLCAVLMAPPKHIVPVSATEDMQTMKNMIDELKLAKDDAAKTTGKL